MNAVARNKRKLWCFEWGSVFHKITDHRILKMQMDVLRPCWICSILFSYIPINTVWQKVGGSVWKCLTEVTRVQSHLDTNMNMHHLPALRHLNWYQSSVFLPDIGLDVFCSTLALKNCLNVLHLTSAYEPTSLQPLGFQVCPWLSFAPLWLADIFSRWVWTQICSSGILYCKHKKVKR